jgi:hypothetical protein
MWHKIGFTETGAAQVFLTNISIQNKPVDMAMRRF